MSFTDKIKANWNQIKGEAKIKWGELTDDDFLKAEGNWDKFIGIVQEKSGEAKEDIQEYFEKLADRFDD